MMRSKHSSCGANQGYPGSPKPEMNRNTMSVAYFCGLASRFFLIFSAISLMFAGGNST